ncbi:endonuclease/exonuclease/phosphatase family metal-dependent hydrolase [Allocatelliglobosispora scoriae]|uniref:Endonuclease/exonuclease/phosphatase family metal-dependent hydrolase n=1 Tax=Allocatelliglobosispora scoriae TaxID=643052 RepID=A0A841BMG1_9ACTN|nr:endonuclease/exonuclease/phosphatase family protein [Allocatelliglobosispora scoriae]MBB5869454.1 endonuclease/exonuclease/phosphatase family metal-dependent hydrolase [Allocatelliglobosispora scoriae]
MGARLRVVSYNVHSSRDDRDALSRVVRGLRPDVLIVQEGPRRFRWRTKGADLAHSFGLFVAGGGLPSLGNVIMTSLRVKVVEAWNQQYPLKPGRHMRGAAFVRIEVEGSPATIVGAHLSTDDEERPSQARLLRDSLDRIDGPVILGVDLNDEPGSESWRIVHDGLTDAAESTGCGGECTFPAHGPHRRIDTLVASTGVTIDAYRVETGPLTLAASDHLPILIDVTLP